MDERTAEIIRRFKESWTTTELFYQDLTDNYPGWQKLEPVKLFIQTLKESGYDSVFRLGTAIHILIISRSVNNGLREDQKCILIDAYENNKFEITLRQGAQIYRQFKTDSFDDIRLAKLINALQDTLVD